MDQLTDILRILKQLKPELNRRFHVKNLGLFGSVTRNDFSVNSDIDIIVDFNQPVGIEFIDLANYLEQNLHKKIDLVSRKGVKDNHLRSFEKDIIYV